jgi:DNA-binding NarL/FixJ family response regulator
MVRQALRSVLESYQDIEIVGEACDGKEAIALAGRMQPTVVLMDINMPKMNGIKATAGIISRHPNIAVIGLSSHVSRADEEAMKKSGASMLFIKEAAVDELYRAIRQVSYSPLATPPLGEREG